jgi:hypothetical protein
MLLLPLFKPNSKIDVSANNDNLNERPHNK